MKGDSERISEFGGRVIETVSRRFALWLARSAAAITKPIKVCVPTRNLLVWQAHYRNSVEE